jgi:raffinose/stachyose/melibiose transport system substrate-binding protein
MRSVVIPLVLLSGVVAGVAAQNSQTDLTVASWKGGGSELAAFPELIAKFEKENPTINVKLQYASNGDHITIMNTKFQAGDAPDVVMVDPGLASKWGDRGVLVDLAKSDWVTRLRPEVRSRVFSNNKLYLFPMELIGIGVYVNMDLLKKAGISKIPTTVAGYKTACAALNKAGITPLMMPAKGSWTPAQWTYAVAIQDALRSNPNFMTDIKNKKATFSGTPAFAKSFTALRDLARANCYNPRQSLGIDPWSTGLDEFQSGRAAFLPQGAWNIANFSKNNKNLDFKFAPFLGLSGSGGAGANFIGTSWAINAKAKNASAAQKWLAFWTKEENLMPFLKAEGANSPLRGGKSGLPALAQPFADAEKLGRVILSPEGYWTSDVVGSVYEATTNFFLNVEQDTGSILKTMDEAISK